MEGGNEELLNLLKDQRDWNLSCIFTDQKKMLVDNGCNLQDEEI